ncbi:hypothetical protein PS623_00541 [Pseudomonas fluorescens]|nr:hypothetical protein PS623_00541 [Pseudomonas fluorescens]
MVMVRYAACPWTEVFAPCSAIVVSLNLAGNGTGRWQQQVGRGAIQELFDTIDKPSFRPSPEAQGVIVNVDIVGTAASGRIDTNDISGFCFTDFFNLLKVEGEWKVISKIYHTHVAP